MPMSRRARILLIGYRKFSELINSVLPEYESEAEVVIVESVASGSVDYHALVASTARMWWPVPAPMPPTSRTAEAPGDRPARDRHGRGRRGGAGAAHRRCACGSSPMPQPELSERVFDALGRLDGRGLRHLRYSTTNEAAEQLLTLAVDPSGRSKPM
jgi:propionate catabolism operon transcriptional regulator